MEESIIHDRIPVMASLCSNPRENDATKRNRYFTISKNSYRSLFHPNVIFISVIIFLYYHSELSNKLEEV